MTNKSTAPESEIDPESGESADADVLVDANDLLGEDTDAPGDAQSEAEKWRNLALRSQAELENYRKRMAREKFEAIQYANASLLASLLPVLDNFAMGLQAAKQESEDNVIYQGFVMVRKQIEDFLAEQGALPVEATGPFDPNQHEAVKEDFNDDIPEGEIISELRRGYRLNDRLLRAANVVVSKGPGGGDA